jgi:hypothetical protein
MSDASHPRDYERSDAAPRLIGALATGLAVFLIVVPLLLFALYPDAPERGGIEGHLQQPPPPWLQVNPSADLAHLHERENAQLNTLGWVDRGKEIVRIPIDDAMRLLSERGLAGWPSSASPPAAASAPQRQGADRQ